MSTWLASPSQRACQAGMHAAACPTAWSPQRLWAPCGDLSKWTNFRAPSKSNICRRSTNDCLQAHGLDEAIGGLLLVAKTRSALTALSLAFTQREVKREYTAVRNLSLGLPAQLDLHASRDMMQKLTRTLWHADRDREVGGSRRHGRAKAGRPAFSDAMVFKQPLLLGLPCMADHCHPHSPNRQYFGASGVAQSLWGLLLRLMIP